MEYDKYTECYILVEADEMSLRIEECLITLKTLTNSRYSEHMADQLEEWYQKFKIFNENFNQ